MREREREERNCCVWWWVELYNEGYGDVCKWLKKGASGSNVVHHMVLRNKLPTLLHANIMRAFSMVENDPIYLGLRQGWNLTAFDQIIITLS